MTDHMRWRYGDTNPVVSPVKRETVIEIGDLLWQDDDGTAEPASTLGCRPGEHEKESFSKRFLGVAMQRSRAGDTDLIRVATTGVFEFDLSGAIPTQLGDFIGPTAGLDSQLVSLTHDAKRAIGRAAKVRPAPLTAILVDIRSTIMTGGVYARS
jgi:hypothetical protein